MKFPSLLPPLLLGLATLSLWAAPIDRPALLARHSPVLRAVSANAPLSVGNGGFVFNVDVTGLQTFQDLHTREGMPLETLGRRYWHSAPNPEGFTLADASAPFVAHGREQSYPTREKTPAGQWLRMNPHQFPLGQVGFVDASGVPLAPADLGAVEQRLDLWRGEISSRFTWRGREVRVLSLVDPGRDRVAVEVRSDALADGSLRVAVAFPRGHDMRVKNTPPHDWDGEDTHRSVLRKAGHPGGWEILRQRDDLEYRVSFEVEEAAAELAAVRAHRFELRPSKGAERLAFTVEFSVLSSPSGPGVAMPPQAGPAKPATVAELRALNSAHWAKYWQAGAAVEFLGSRYPRAAELERRVVLSQYLCAIQIAGMPPQETGLTCNSWYGKHHTEMVWWHVAHFNLWGRPGVVDETLAWFESVLPRARQTAAERGLRGARWSKMVGPDGRESPGGTALIWWNQPHPIHLAELQWLARPTRATLERWSTLVLETAECMASMLQREEGTGRWVLGPPMWIAQELYDQKRSMNPTYELTQWRWALGVAQQWRERLGLPRDKGWDERLAGLPAPTVREGKYVSMESIPDTWENAGARHDHPSFLMAQGMLPGPGIDRDTMHRTLLATLGQWRWEVKIWGWDYPMIAMSAARLGERAAAVEVLLRDAPNNRYLANGHCPQRRDLGVYLPANGSLLAAVAMMAGGWDGAPAGAAPGFPADGSWTVRAEGLSPLP